MAITNHERVGKALDLLKAGLGPFVQREVQGAIESRKAGCPQAAPLCGRPSVGEQAHSQLGRRRTAQADVGNLERCLSEHPWARRARFRR